MMNKNFLSMKNKVGANCQDTSSNFLILVGGWLNDRLVEVMRRANHIQTSRIDFSISATGGTEDYILPSDFKECVSLLDKTNKVRLSQMDFQEWVSTFKDYIDTQSTVTNYIIFDDVVMNQPSSASVITFVSSSASDSTQTMYVRGVVGNGEDYETVTLSGTTPVATTKSFTRIYAIGKDVSTVGVVTVTANVGATTVAYVSREALQTRFKKLRLASIPSNAISLEMVYIQSPLPMSQNYDYPMLDCEDVLEAGATADALKYKRQYAKGDYWENMFEKRLDDFMWDRENKPDMIHTFKPIPYNRDFI